MIIAAGKNKGRRLVRLIAESIRDYGYAEVAVLSLMGLGKLNNAGQSLANASGVSLNAVPEEREVQMEDGSYRLAVVVKMSLEGYEQKDS